ncbi:rsc3p [Saccharomyces arboricola H-6]|uniref:Rsc3p n=1 Tax=Saccharomyces arboricola (strain H-6 / AS 2.3317 / CBS 10644) TaxID=1160507 RepID=J8PJI7_SACAR|nr:rsc3p [Saccharomyces arboricola H-6]
MDIRGRKMKKPPACVQCRKRKIGCDRVKPICGNCMKHNKMDCFYPDVPGQYVPSSSSSSSTRQVGNGPYLSSYYASSRRVSKETAALLQKNPELASLEQIREYNTRLQLLNAQNQLNNRSSVANATLNQQHTQYIPKSVPSLESKPVTSANESSTPLNWVQGPAIFHMLTSPYTQDEIINHEMNFLKGRLLELQEITGKKVTGVNLDIKQDFSLQIQSSQSNRSQVEFLTIKKRKMSDDDTTDGEDKTTANDERRSHLNEFKDLDPQFLDTNKVFNVFNAAISRDISNTLWLLPKNINKNSIFQIQYLVERDPFLFKFFNKLNTLIEKQFDERSRDLLTSSNSTPDKSIISQFLKFPQQSVTQNLINKYLSTITETNSILPILKPKRLLPIVEQLFPSNTINKPNSNELETVFQVTNLSNDQLTNLGFITLCLLILFESLNSTVLIPLRDEEHLQLFNVLFNYLPSLKTNLTILRFEIDKRSMCNIDTLRFISLWKYYQFVITTSSSVVIDYDEDMQMACLLSLNHETQNQSHVLIWNFIFKNYCWRHLFLGQLPLLMSEPFTNSTPIIDPLLNNDFELIDFEMNLMKYLQSKDQQLSIDKIIQLIKVLKTKNIEVSQRCLTTSSIINNIMDSLIYRNSMLYLNFYLLLQFETLQNASRFYEILDNFLELSRETLFFVFSNLANIKFAGHEFTFINKSIAVLRTLVSMLLALYQRSFESSQTTNNEKENQLNQTESNHSSSDNNKRIKNKNVIHLIINKIAMLLGDYTKNCKKQNKLIENLITKIKMISKYIKDLEESKTPYIEDPDYATNNGFTGISADHLIKLNHELNKISESLIKTDFYEQRKNSAVVPGATATVDSDANVENFGLTKENFSEIFEAIRS